MIRNDNYIVIQGFMVNELQLKGSELLIYAIIYGFSQTKGTAYNGGLTYLGEWVGITKSNVILNLQKLEQKGLIIKTEKRVNNVKFCEYSVNIEGGIKTIPLSSKNTEGWYQNNNGVVLKQQRGGIKTIPNNIDNNINNNIDIYLVEKSENFSTKKDPNQNCDDDFTFDSIDNTQTKLTTNDLPSAEKEKVAQKRSIEERSKEFMCEVAQVGGEKYSKEMLRAFYDYWTEINENGKKMRWEKEKTWNLERRLARWFDNSKFKKTPQATDVDLGRVIAAGVALANAQL